MSHDKKYIYFSSNNGTDSIYWVDEPCYRFAFIAWCIRKRFMDKYFSHRDAFSIMASHGLLDNK
ncbi:hypothetical protein PSKAS_01430 [Peribacillus sp. N1]